MAEKGSASGAGTSAADSDEGKSFDQIFHEELNKPDTEAGAGAGSGAGETGGSAGTAGTGETDKDTPPAGAGSEGETNKTDSVETEEGARTGVGSDETSTELSQADREFVRGRGLDDKDITPREVANLRKATARLEQQIREATNKVEFFGNSNKDLSGKYQKLKSLYKEIAGQQTPQDQVRGIISKIDKSKLSPAAQELLEDPAYLEVNTAILSALLPKQTVPGLEDDEEETAAGGEGAAAAAGDTGAKGAPSAGQEQPHITEEQARQIISDTVSKVTVALKDKHPDLPEIYGSDDFRKWTETQSRYEVMKLFTSDPQAHDEVITRYKADRAVRQQEEETTKNSEKGKNALRTHQSQSSPGGKTQVSAEPTPEQILKDDKVFDAMTTKINQSRVKTG